MTWWSANISLPPGRGRASGRIENRQSIGRHPPAAMYQLPQSDRSPPLSAAQFRQITTGNQTRGQRPLNHSGPFACPRESAFIRAKILPLFRGATALPTGSRQCPGPSTELDRITPRPSHTRVASGRKRTPAWQGRHRGRWVCHRRANMRHPPAAIAWNWIALMPPATLRRRMS